ncbi:MAG: hypothetical protein AAF628_27195 [Planctomycetota bacterium]
MKRLSLLRRRQADPAPLPNGRRAERGVTMVETAMASVIAVIVMVGVTRFVKVGSDHAQSVGEETQAGSAIRDAAERIARDLRQSGSVAMSVEQQIGQNDALKLKRPIAVSGGALTWGVSEKKLGSKAGWAIRYDVKRVKPRGGNLRRDLVRRIIDDAGTVFREEVLLRNLRTGVATPPGFKVEQSGKMWKVTLSQRANRKRPMHTVSFDLALYN